MKGNTYLQPRHFAVLEHLRNMRYILPKHPPPQWGNKVGESLNNLLWSV